MDILLVILFGVAGGFVGGMVGVGGGILFVPALVIVLDESQVEAEATSLLAIVIVAIAGTIRQRRYGNVRMGDAARDRRACRSPGWPWESSSRTRCRSEPSRSASRSSRWRSRPSWSTGASDATPGSSAACIDVQSPDSSAPLTPASSAFTR